MKRTSFLLLLLWATLVAQAQLDFKLYYANNVGEVAHLSRLKATDSGLKWKEIVNGDVDGNRTEVEEVKKMFSETRQKTRADQELFWKMRDDNLLCFRINDGKGTYGEFEARVSSGSRGFALKRNVTNYFFVNTDNKNDSLFVKVNRKGCGPNDTLTFRYYIYDWNNDDLLTFKLDSRRSNSGLTYQLEYVTSDIQGKTRETHRLNLSGKSFQSFYRPADRDVKEVWLVSNDSRLKLDDKRLMWGANLSDKLNRLWMGNNFTLDKHKDRELTIFNMLGSGLFEQYDTLHLKVMGKNGPIKAEVDPQTKLAKGFVFNVVEVDVDGKYKKTEGIQMKYAAYDAKNGIHKILTYGNPCYMEVYAPGHYPALYKYAGARDPKTKVLNQDRTSGTLRLIAGTATATGPDISSHFLHVLKDEKKEVEYDGKLHKVFSEESCDMSKLPPSGFYSFLEDGGCQEQPKLLNNKPIDKYAEVSIDYSMPKSGNASGNVAVLKFEENGSTATPVTVDPSSSVTINGNDYPGFQRSWYTLRWNIVGKLANKNVNYKPRLTIGPKTYNELPFIRRLEIDEKKIKEDAQKQGEEYCFNTGGDIEYNGWGSMSVFGNLAKFDLRLDRFPGFGFSVVPYFEPLKGIFELDLNVSYGFGRENKNDKSGMGQKWRENIRDKGKITRSKMAEWDGKNAGNVGVDGMLPGKTSKLDKEHWVQAEMDDIFSVAFNKMGGGPFIDGHFGFGFQMWDNVITQQPSNHGFYLKGVDVAVGYGYFLTYNWDLLEDKKATWAKYFNIRAYINFVAQARLHLGFKSYNFKRNGTFKTKYGFFINGLLQCKAGGGFQLETDFAHGDNHNPNPGGGGQGDDQGGGQPAAQPAAQPTSKGTWGNRFFSAAIGARIGAKLQASLGFTTIFGDDDHNKDFGLTVLLLGAIEGYADIRIGPLFRYNPRWLARGAFVLPIPDNEHNPTIPYYPNYKPEQKAPALSFWRAPSVARPEFMLGKCVMEGLNYQARPFFMGDDNFVMVNNGNGSDLNQERLTDYDVPTTDDKMDKNDGLDLSEEGRWAQNHSCAKEGPNEMIVYEEMTCDVDNSQMQGGADVEKGLEQTRHMQIASLLKSETTGIWKHYVVAYDENVQDSDPIVAINVFTEDGATAIPGEEDQAVCVWKRGQYVLPPYEEEGSTEEENLKRKADYEASGVRAFEGDVMLSLFDKDHWGAPEKVVSLTKEDILSDFQVLMCNDTALIALTVLPKDKNSLELRYYCKPYGEPVQYIATDKANPVRFSLDLVGAIPTIAILNQVDSANKDIYVKHIDMKGRYTGYGTDLNIARFNPESVKIITDKKNERPEDFAVVWKCADKLIHREGKIITTDSTQTMLNCSRIYMRENMTAIPYVTLGCTADSTYMSGFDVIMEDMQLKTLYALTDLRDGNTYLMKDTIKFDNNFQYSIGYSQEAMIDTDVMPVNLTIYNTGATPITFLEGFINDQVFQFEDIFINPYTSQVLTVEFEIPENFDGLLKAHDVTAIFEDAWLISKASRRGALLRRAVKADEDVSEYASGTSDLRCELLSHTITGTVNKVYLELTDFDGLNANETVHVGLYPDHFADVPITSTAEVLLKASDFTVIGNDRKAYVELTVDGLEEAQTVEIRARVYNDRVLEALDEDDDIGNAIVDNLSWQDNQHIITLLPTELDNVTLLPVVKRDDIQHKVKVEQTEQGVWISGLEESDHVRIFDAAGRPVYQQSHPQSRLFAPIMEHGVYLLSTGQEFVKFSF